MKIILFLILVLIFNLTIIIGQKLKKLKDETEINTPILSTKGEIKVNLIFVAFVYRGIYQAR